MSLKHFPTKQEDGDGVADYSNYSSDYLKQGILSFLVQCRCQVTRIIPSTQKLKLSIDCIMSATGGSDSNWQQIILCSRLEDQITKQAPKNYRLPESLP